MTIAQAIDSQVSRAIVTTDSNEIRDVAIKYGAEVPYLRSKELSNDTAAIEPVITDVLAYLEKSQNYIPDCVVLLMPTSPLRLVSDIDNALNIYRKSNLSSVVSVSRAVANQNPHWMLKKNKDGTVSLFTGKNLSEIASRRQNLPDVYFRNDFVYVLDPNNLCQNPANLYGDMVELLVADDGRVELDINNESDWLAAETIFKVTNQFAGE